MQVNDPVEQGFVASLAHPANNTTGFTQMSAELDPKRLQLLHDIAPLLPRATFLVNPHLTPGLAARVAQAEAAAKTAPRGNRRQTSLLPKHTSMPNRPAMTAHEGRVELLSALASGRVGVVTITESSIYTRKAGPLTIAEAALGRNTVRLSALHFCSVAD